MKTVLRRKFSDILLFYLKENRNHFIVKSAWFSFPSLLLLPFFLALMQRNI